MKYKLTFGQRVELFFIWFLWTAQPEEKRKTWHEVKKGMEKHVHNYTIPTIIHGHKFLQCSHEGCNMVDDAEPF